MKDNLNILADLIQKATSENLDETRKLALKSNVFLKVNPQLTLTKSYNALTVKKLSPVSKIHL